VHRFEREDAQDEGVQGSLHEIGGPAHVVSVTETMP
jgi:hypothetical protein